MKYRIAAAAALVAALALPGTASAGGNVVTSKIIGNGVHADIGVDGRGNRLDYEALGDDIRSRVTMESDYSTLEVVAFPGSRSDVRMSGAGTDGTFFASPCSIGAHEDMGHRGAGEIRVARCQ